MSEPGMPLRLFEGYGVEIEYIIVREDDLSVLPVSDRLLEAVDQVLALEAHHVHAHLAGQELHAHGLGHLQELAGLGNAEKLKPDAWARLAGNGVGRIEVGDIMAERRVPAPMSAKFR